MAGICRISRLSLALFGSLLSSEKKLVTYHLSRKDSEKLILAQGEFSGKKGSCDTSLFSLEIPVVHSHCMSIEENNRNKKKSITSRQSIRSDSGFTRVKTILELYIYGDVNEK